MTFFTRYDCSMCEVSWLFENVQPQVRDYLRQWTEVNDFTQAYKTKHLDSKWHSEEYKIRKHFGFCTWITYSLKGAVSNFGNVMMLLLWPAREPSASGMGDRHPYHEAKTRELQRHLLVCLLRSWTAHSVVCLRHFFVFDLQSLGWARKTLFSSHCTYRADS